MKETENKYYTPTIEEFHVGFEYEAEDYDGKGIFFWAEEVYKGEEMRTFLIQELEDKKIRVKYLDQEDIKSLGWVKGKYKSLNIYQKGNYIITTPLEAYNNTHVIDISILKVIGEGIDRMFRGVIKNKSELKKLMQQLRLI